MPCPSRPSTPPPHARSPSATATAAPSTFGGRAGRQHFWRYYDAATRQVMDNRYLIANLIQCQPDTPRYIPTGDVDIFAVQEAVIQDILQSAQEQQAVEAAPRKIDPVQQTLITLLRSAAGRAELALGGPSRPAWDRRQLLDLVKLLGRPLPNVHVRALRRAYERHQASAEVEALVAAVEAVRDAVGEAPGARRPTTAPLDRDSLHLICFDYVWS